jgi:hypothetical protein
VFFILNFTVLLYQIVYEEFQGGHE